MVCVDTKTEIFEKGGKNKNISIKKLRNSDKKKNYFTSTNILKT